MEIQFGVTHDNRKKLYKTFTVIKTLNGHLKEETDMVNPVIRVTTDVLNSCNYAYIPEFGRYYFIDSPAVSVRTNLYDVTLKCDVLMSFEQEIINVPIIAERSTNIFNGYLPDNQREFLAYPLNQYITLGYIGEFGNVMLLGVG